MNHEERLKFAEGIFDQCLDIMRTKGLSYASEGDASENFKRIAEATGQTKYQVWAVYFGKHVLSLNNAVKRNPDLPAVADGEPIAGRVADIINYAVLLAMMVQDDEVSAMANSGHIVEPENNPLFKLSGKDHPKWEVE